MSLAYLDSNSGSLLSSLIGLVGLLVFVGGAVAIVVLIVMSVRNKTAQRPPR